MRILDIFSRMIRRADLMDAMMDKLGVADDMQRLPDSAGVLRRAAGRCLTCDQPDACHQWLDHQTDPDSAPDFCRNRDLFARVMSGMGTGSGPSIPS